MSSESKKKKHEHVYTSLHLLSYLSGKWGLLFSLHYTIARIVQLQTYASTIAECLCDQPLYLRSSNVQVQLHATAIVHVAILSQFKMLSNLATYKIGFSSTASFKVALSHNSQLNKENWVIIC